MNEIIETLKEFKYQSLTTFNFCVLMNEIYRNFERIRMFYETIGIIHIALTKKGLY